MDHNPAPAAQQQQQSHQQQSHAEQPQEAVKITGDFPFLAPLAGLAIPALEAGLAGLVGGAATAVAQRGTEALIDKVTGDGPISQNPGWGENMSGPTYVESVQSSSGSTAHPSIPGQSSLTVSQRSNIESMPNPASSLPLATGTTTYPAQLSAPQQSPMQVTPAATVQQVQRQRLQQEVTSALQPHNPHSSNLMQNSMMEITNPNQPLQQHMILPGSTEYQQLMNNLQLLDGNTRARLFHQLSAPSINEAAVAIASGTAQNAPGVQHRPANTIEDHRNMALQYIRSNPDSGLVVDNNQRVLSRNPATGEFSLINSSPQNIVKRMSSQIGKAAIEETLRFGANYLPESIRPAAKRVLNRAFDSSPGPYTKIHILDADQVRRPRQSSVTIEEVFDDYPAQQRRALPSSNQRLAITNSNAVPIIARPPQTITNQMNVQPVLRTSKNAVNAITYKMAGDAPVTVQSPSEQTQGLYKVAGDAPVQANTAEAISQDRTAAAVVLSGNRLEKFVAKVRTLEELHDYIVTSYENPDTMYQSLVNDTRFMQAHYSAEVFEMRKQPSGAAYIPTWWTIGNPASPNPGDVASFDQRYVDYAWYLTPATNAIRVPLIVGQDVVKLAQYNSGNTLNYSNAFRMKTGDFDSVALTSASKYIMEKVDNLDVGISFGEPYLKILLYMQQCMPIPGVEMAEWTINTSIRPFSNAHQEEIFNQLYNDAERLVAPWNWPWVNNRHQTPNINARICDYRDFWNEYDGKSQRPWNQGWGRQYWGGDVAVIFTTLDSLIDPVQNQVELLSVVQYPAFEKVYFAREADFTWDAQGEFAGFNFFRYPGNTSAFLSVLTTVSSKPKIDGPYGRVLFVLVDALASSKRNITVDFGLLSNSAGHQQYDIFTNDIGTNVSATSPVPWNNAANTDIVLEFPRLSWDIQTRPYEWVINFKTWMNRWETDYGNAADRNFCYRLASNFTGVFALKPNFHRGRATVQGELSQVSSLFTMSRMYDFMHLPNAWRINTTATATQVSDMVKRWFMLTTDAIGQIPRVAYLQAESPLPFPLRDISVYNGTITLTGTTNPIPVVFPPILSEFHPTGTPDVYTFTFQRRRMFDKTANLGGLIPHYEYQLHDYLLKFGILKGLVALNIESSSRASQWRVTDVATSQRKAGCVLAAASDLGHWRVGYDALCKYGMDTVFLPLNESPMATANYQALRSSRGETLMSFLLNSGIEYLTARARINYHELQPQISQAILAVYSAAPSPLLQFVRVPMYDWPDLDLPMMPSIQSLSFRGYAEVSGMSINTPAVNFNYGTVTPTDMVYAPTHVDNDDAYNDVVVRLTATQWVNRPYAGEYVWITDILKKHVAFPLRFYYSSPVRQFTNDFALQGITGSPLITQIFRGRFAPFPCSYMISSFAPNWNAPRLYLAAEFLSGQTLFLSETKNLPVFIRPPTNEDIKTMMVPEGLNSILSQPFSASSLNE